MDGISVKEKRFKRVAGRRVQEILKKLQLLGNCSNKNNYDYTEEQVKKIFRAVDNEWKHVKSEFERELKRKKEFKL